MNNSSDLEMETESYKAALALKEEGNAVFKKGVHKQALKHYTKMLIHLGMKPTFAMSSLVGAGAINREEEDGTDDDPLKKIRSDADSLRKTCFNNISAVYAKMGDWAKSLEKAQKVLEMDDKNKKALFRIGVAYRNLKEFEKAKESLLNAQKLGDSASIRNELRRVDAAVSAQRAKDDKRLKRAFKKAAASKASKPAEEEKPTVEGEKVNVAKDKEAKSTEEVKGTCEEQKASMEKDKEVEDAGEVSNVQQSKDEKDIKIKRDRELGITKIPAGGEEVANT